MKEQKMNIRVPGIDCGTGYLKAAYLDDTGKPKVVPNLDGEFKTAAIFYFGPKLQEILVGRAAQNMMFVDPARTIKEAKRDVGSRKVYFTEGGVDITPEECMTQGLKYLRQCMIGYSGDDRAASEAVVSVPASFKDDQRQAIMHAAERAGIKVLALINEPTAAGIAHGLSEKQGDRLVLVPDWGHGTLDVSVIQYAGGKVDVIASAGDNQLGGKDVNEIVVGMVNETFKSEHGIEISPEQCPADCYGIWLECVRTKELLSSKREARLVVRALGKQVVLDIKREQLEGAVAPLMSRARQLILDVLGEAKINPEDVDQVLCIGGSSRLTAFQKTIRDIFGKDKVIGGNVSPDFAVVEGAAIKAGQIVFKSGAILVDETLKAIPTPAIESTDIVPHSLGVAVQDRVSSAEYFAEILRKNTPIPCTMTKMFGSVSPDQDRFKIMVLQGKDGQDIKDCLVVAQKELTLPPRSPDEESLEITMAYDESGMVDVNVKDLVSGKTANITVDHYQKERTKQGDEAAKQAPAHPKGRKAPCKVKKV